MCETCGCNDPENQHSIANPVFFRSLPGGKKIKPADISPVKEIQVARDVLSRNDLIAEENRRLLDERSVFTLNMTGSPGSGKTSLIVKTIEALAEETTIYVIEGDQYGSLDSDRISLAGAPVLQINTGNGCHLDAESISKAIDKLNPQPHSLLIIENVGNLVCPAMFYLGEHKRAVVLSVTEGDDKPVKYAPMFYGSAICVINKTDLAKYVDFNMDMAKTNLRKINHHLTIMECSATTGNGVDDWISMLRAEMKKLQSQSGI